MELSSGVGSVRSVLSGELWGNRQTPLTWRRRIWLYRNGFLSSREPIWDLTPETADLYLSDLEYRRIRGIDDEAAATIDNKVLFHLIVSSSHEYLLPDLYGHVRDGEFLDTDRYRQIPSFERLLDRLEDEPVVVKPVQAAKGDGVRVIEKEDGRLYLDNEEIWHSQLREALVNGRECILTEHVCQAEYAASVYPASANSIRFLTMIDPETDEPFIPRAVHRFGTDASGHVDNWGAGGLSANVDLENGTLGPAIVNPDVRTLTTGGDTSDRNESPDGWVDTHPDTGTRITGRKIPEWDQIRETVLDLTAEYGWLWSHIGWDVVVRDDDGSFAVLEGELQCVDADIQAHGPLLADRRVRRYYNHHGVLSGGGILP